MGDFTIQYGFGRDNVTVMVAEYAFPGDTSREILALFSSRMAIRDVSSDISPA